MISIKALQKLLISLMLICTVGAAVFSAFVFVTLFQMEGIQVLETYKPPTPTQILDVNNDLIAEFYRERRELVNYPEISPNLIMSTLSIEDKRFFSHYGVDFIRIMKALWVNFLALKKKQGGSTITIQLSKLIFLDHKKTFTRKITELWYAIQIEKQYTKEEILKFYFNQVNYGHGSYGVGAASKFYFQKPVKALSVAESSLLSGIPKSPVYYSPIRYPKKSTERHQTVLNAMVRNNFIDQQTASREYQNFWQYFTSKNRSQQASFSDFSKNKAPYFTEYIRAKLERDFPKKELYEKGIKVYTTVNLKHQRAAQEILWTKLKEQEKFKKLQEKYLPQNLSLDVLKSLSVYSRVFNFPKLDFQKEIDQYLTIEEINQHQAILKQLGGLLNHSGLNQLGYHQFNFQKINFTFNDKVQGALIAIEPKSGYITAMIGGSLFNYNNQFNRSIDLERQIGSILKPFIYAVALDRNLIRANTLLNDVPTQFGSYVPKNYGNNYRGKVTVRDALRKSINVLAVEVLGMTGTSYTRNRLAGIFGVRTETSLRRKFPPDLTMALGTGSFSVLSVATAYAVLANEGKEVIPKTVRYVTDQNGEMLRNYEEEYTKYKERQLINKSSAYIIRNIISGVFTPGGTAYKPKLLKDFKHRDQSFGKTGTTSNWKDAWFAGANQYLSTAVWMGYDDNRSLGRHRTGGKMSAPVWIEFQKKALNHLPKLSEVPPKGVIRKRVCLSCEGIAGPSCPPSQVRYEYFKIDNYPQEICYDPNTKIEKETQFKNFIQNFEKNNLSKRFNLDN